MSLKKKLYKNQGFFYILPWIIGFLVLGLFPIGMSVYLGFTKWPIIGNPKFVGLKNYINIFKSPLFYNVAIDTIVYAFFSVVLGMISSFIIAMLLNTNVKGLSIFRTIYYLPAVVSGVSIAIMWRWIYEPNYGILNEILKLFHLKPKNWLGDQSTIIPAYILIAIWGAGGGMLTYLVGLKDVPKVFYEAAHIEGAGWWRRLFQITIPTMSPILLYNLIVNIIGSLRQFAYNYILGGKKFYMLYVYENAFENNKMGFASALSWILVLFILLLTIIVFKSSSLWVYYETEQKNKKRK